MTSESGKITPQPVYQKGFFVMVQEAFHSMRCDLCKFRLVEFAVAICVIHIKHLFQVIFVKGRVSPVFRVFLKDACSARWRSGMWRNELPTLKTKLSYCLCHWQRILCSGSAEVQTRWLWPQPALAAARTQQPVPPRSMIRNPDMYDPGCERAWGFSNAAWL